MSDENKAVVRRYFEAMDRADTSVLDELFAGEYQLHASGAPGPLDRAGFEGFVAGFFAAFPGIYHDIEDMIAQGDRVAVRLTVRGTQRGEFQGIPATGKDVAISVINILRLEGGRIREQWIQMDALGLLQQLGAIPAAA